MSYDEKSTVSIDADGNVLKCAKGANASECGFVKGAEICAKCGAMPVEMKMIPASNFSEKGVMMQAPDDELSEDEMLEDEMPVKKSKKEMKPGGVPVASEMDEEMDDEEDDMEYQGKMKRPVGIESAYAKAMMDEEDMEDDDVIAEDGDEMMEEDDADSTMDEEMTEEDDEETPVMRKKMGKYRKSKAEIEIEMNEEGEDEEEMEDEEEEEEDEETPMMGEKSFSSNDPEWSEIRKSRIKSLGIKTADLGAHGYLCAIERKAYAGSSPVCDDCPGGCVAEKGLPGLLHVEGLAEKMFNGVVIDSGYSQDADMFVVDVQTKDGYVKEVFVDGTSAEVLGFHRLDESEFEQKSDFADYKLIDFTEAAEIAVKSIDGHVVAVEPDVFEGFDAYAVEIEGFDGKSYDVFVALDGEVLGYDKYEADEVEQIEAEAAEIAIKRAFSEERRMELAKEGMALSDGSYPIVSEADLRNAIQAFGRAKDKEATKRHIMKRARDLKLESLIPANWVAGSKEKSEAPNDAEFIAALVEFQLLEDSIDNQ